MEQAGAMLLEQQEFYRSISSRFPGLIEKIQALIERTEAEYSGESGRSEGFLWEHTVLVASLAYKLAGTEKERPDIASLAALFHDAGKFEGGEYHSGEKPEEEGSAALARRLLVKAGVGRSTVEHITGGLLALYRSGGRTNRLARILHDADFLAKSGSLGIANFFVKSTLRGRNLERTIMESLSKELTYAAALPRNMRTEEGRRLAEKKSRETLRFHRTLLRELRESHDVDFRVKTFTVSHSRRPQQKLRIRIVMPPVCAPCNAAWRVELRTETGIKCETLEAQLSCGGCGRSRRISFCLPELA